MSDIPAGRDPAGAVLDDDEAGLGPLEDENPDEPEDGEGDEADESGGDAEAVADDEPQGRPQEVGGGRRARGQAFGSRIRGLEAELAEERTRVRTFEQQLQTLLAERNQPRAPSPAEIAEQQRQERERFEMMSPYEQHLYTQQKIEQGVAQRTQAMAQTLWDQGDRRAYEDLLERTPAYRKFDAKVEELRRQAPGVERRVLLATAIGLQALDQGGAARSRAARAAEAGRAANGVRPSQARGDVPAQRTRRADDLEERLRGQSI